MDSLSLASDIHTTQLVRPRLFDNHTIYSIHVMSSSSTTTQWTKKVFTLNTGAKMPAIGLGTWQSGKGEVRQAVIDAIKAGYRHIDTALAYGNESEVGQGIRDSGVPRDEIWVTTKLDNTWHHRVSEGIDSSLKSLGLEYVDLYLVHWPASSDPSDEKKPLADWNFEKTWLEMQKLPATGKVKAIGVSNFAIKNLEILLKNPELKIVPAVNQVELHPNNPSPKVCPGFCTWKASTGVLADTLTFLFLARGIL